MILLFTSILITTVTMPIIINVFFAENIYIDNRKEELLEIYDKIIDDYSDNVINIYKTVNNFEDEINLRVLIFDQNGSIVYQTFSGIVTEDLIRLYDINDNGSISDNFTSTPLVNIVQSYRNNTETIAVRGSVETARGTHYVILESPLSAISDATATINRLIIIMSFSALLVGAFVIYYFSKRITKPILEINDVAKSVANMHFDKKASSTNRNDELATLAKNINFMSDQMESMIYDLRVANIELQKDNDIRRQIDDMRRDFIANVSHELKTPLSLMQGYSEMLKENIEGIDKDFYYDVIIDESKHMNELVRRLLDISSLENGLTKLNYETFNLSELTVWIVSKNEIILNENNLKVNGDFTTECNVFADKLLIEQAITNFLSNAITYAKTDIKIKITSEDYKVRFEITNDGASISDDDLEKIWYSFYRTDKARTRSKDKNFGLGLYIVKTIINAHEGEFGAYNNAENHVTFWFELNQE